MQTILPLIPPGASKISDIVSVWRENDRWTYFLGCHPVYFHESNDTRMFRMVTAQLIESGACRQTEIIKAFGISKSSVVRSQNKLREGGPGAFFKPRPGRTGGTVITPSIREKAQSLLDQGESRRSVEDALNIRHDTLRKAINDGRLHERKPVAVIAAKSERTVIDASAAEGMGTACTRVAERVFASFGKSMGASMEFEACLDVPHGGVLCALPALIANGLFKKTHDLLGKVNGYYTMIHVLLVLAFMALCRIKNVDQLKGHAPGEFGKLLGLDRIPEARCLRNKMEELSRNEAAENWAAHLCRYWLEANSQAAGFLYIDGHVRVYHGHLTKPPRRFVSRERLCLRGSTDYWVNDAIGQPFFVVEKQIDPGLLKTLSDDIIPQLLTDVPNQPDQTEFDENPYKSRFVLVFDREGYSPEFFRNIWQTHRIACITYRKYTYDAWPLEWFSEHTVTMPRGEHVTIKLAEMGTLVGSGKNTLWMKEIRRLTESGHQTSLISSAYELPHTQLAAQMFSRWCQENFFGYMMEHFAIDLLQEYGVEAFPDTEIVVNPLWREKNKKRNSAQNKLRYRRARFTTLSMNPESEDNEDVHCKWVKRKAELLEEIESFEQEIQKLKHELKQIPKHISWKELKMQDKFYKLKTGRKRLMDTIRMIAYRAETAMANLLQSKTVNSSDARSLLQDLFLTEADILPEPENKRIRIRVHNASTPAANRSIDKLLTELNLTAMEYPATDLKLYYELCSPSPESGPMVSIQLHRGQEV